MTKGARFHIYVEAQDVKIRRLTVPFTLVRVPCDLSNSGIDATNVYISSGTKTGTPD